MSARIEDLLVGAIAKASKAVEDAKAQLEDYQRDVSELEALLASHRLRTTTVEAADPFSVHCGRCGVALHQEGNRWVGADLIGYCDGEHGGQHVAVSSGGGGVDQNPTSIRLPRYEPATQAGPMPPGVAGFIRSGLCKHCGQEMWLFAGEPWSHGSLGELACSNPEPNDAPSVDSHPTGAHQLPDPAATLTDPPATPKDGAQ